jgi:hypothetical protein
VSRGFEEEDCKPRLEFAARCKLMIIFHSQMNATDKVVGKPVTSYITKYDIELKVDRHGFLIVSVKFNESFRANDMRFTEIKIGKKDGSFQSNFDDFVFVCESPMYGVGDGMWWYKNGELIPDEVDNPRLIIEGPEILKYSVKSILRIQNATDDDVGKYECKAERTGYGDRIVDDNNHFKLIGFFEYFCTSLPTKCSNKSINCDATNYPEIVFFKKGKKVKSMNLDIYSKESSNSPCTHRFFLTNSDGKTKCIAKDKFFDKPKKLFGKQQSFEPVWKYRKFCLKNTVLV